MSLNGIYHNIYMTKAMIYPHWRCIMGHAREKIIEVIKLAAKRDYRGRMVLTGEAPVTLYLCVLLEFRSD